MRLALAAAAALLLSTQARAADDIAAASKCVDDRAHLIGAAEKQAIDKLCLQFDQLGIAQLAVATTPDLGDRTLSEYASDYFKKRALGHSKTRGDGILVLAAPGTQHKWGVRVEVGLDLQGILPDGKVGALLDKFWVPARDRGAYGEGIVHVVQGLAVVIGQSAAAGGDAAPTDESRRAAARNRARASSGPELNAGALALAIFSMLGLLIVLATSATRRTFPGKGTGLLALTLGGGTVVGLFLMTPAGAGWIAFLVGVVVNGLTWFSIRSHKCPKDGSWMMIEEQVLEQPTYFSSGVAEVWEHCTSKACGYERTYEKVLPQKQIVVTGGGGGGGGGGSSGGSDDSLVGGGGDSDGGGAERD